MKLVLVEGVRQDVIVVDGTEATTLGVSVSKDKLQEVARRNPLDGNALTAAHFLLEPELTILVFKHGEEGLKDLNGDHVFDRNALVTAGADLLNDINHDPKEQVDNKDSTGRDLSKQLSKIVLLNRVEVEAGDW